MAVVAVIKKPNDHLEPTKVEPLKNNKIKISDNTTTTIIIIINVILTIKNDNSMFYSHH